MASDHPSNVDALFAQINVTSAPKGAYKKATLGGGDGFRGGHFETGNYFLPHPKELDCSCVTPARWREGVTRDMQIKSYTIQFGFKIHSQSSANEAFFFFFTLTSFYFSLKFFSHYKHNTCFL